MRYLIVLALVFSFAGFANADSIPMSADPKNETTVWTQTVYNGSGTDIKSATAVRWDCGASTTDMQAWVETESSTVADIRTAGATPYDGAIANGAVGDIIVKGPCIMYAFTNTTGAGTGCEADASGRPVDETLAAADEALLGWTIVADASTAANTSLNSQYAVIFIQPTPYSGD